MEEKYKENDKNNRDIEKNTPEVSSVIENQHVRFFNLRFMLCLFFILSKFLYGFFSFINFWKHI